MATLADFWHWGYSDLMSDGVRGTLAEFIVARLIQSPTLVGSSWREWDLKTAHGRPVEVKSSAYVNAWNVDRNGVLVRETQISFSGLKCGLLTEQGFAKPDYHSDIFVFCVLTPRKPEGLDPLDLTQWEFYVLTVDQLRAMDPTPDRLSLKRLRALTEGRACAWNELRSAVEAAERTLSATPREAE